MASIQTTEMSSALSQTITAYEVQRLTAAWDKAKRRNNELELEILVWKASYEAAISRLRQYEDSVSKSSEECHLSSWPCRNLHKLRGMVGTFKRSMATLVPFGMSLGTLRTVLLIAALGAVWEAVVVTGPIVASWHEAAVASNYNLGLFVWGVQKLAITYTLQLAQEVAPDVALFTIGYLFLWAVQNAVIGNWRYIRQAAKWLTQENVLWAIAAIACVLLVMLGLPLELLRPVGPVLMLAAITLPLLMSFALIVVLVDWVITVCSDYGSLRASGRMCLAG
ncbi:hypothetical protein Vretimale_18421 [Volvox reticuliferus]|uniref:Uncharacterized protein n=1 Tax=Volvox reticuliferus TaxID=1737510 RepID=A0A8J4LZF5_9CHLO|nr:hypothetical protein Vretifemale_19151 [Volvox reticuliferus]GIM15674.1 hypothetical protein Vretimale_18421 [Volvox reticuliferus]